MNRNVVVAEQNLDKEQKSAVKQYRSASVSEVVAAPTRQLRSGRPEVVYYLEHKTSKVSKDTGSSKEVSESLSALGAAALVPSAPVASSSSRGTPLTFTQPSVTIAAWPPPYSALPIQSLPSSGINAPLRHFLRNKLTTGW